MKKKAQNGNTLSPYMQKRAAQQKVREDIVRKKDSIMQRNATASGKDMETYKKDARKATTGYTPVEGTGSLNEARKGYIKDCKGKQCGIAKEAGKAEQSAKYKKNGGRITSKKK